MKEPGVAEVEAWTEEARHHAIGAQTLRCACFGTFPSSTDRITITGDDYGIRFPASPSSAPVGSLGPWVFATPLRFVADVRRPIALRAAGYFPPEAGHQVNREQGGTQNEDKVHERIV